MITITSIGEQTILAIKAGYDTNIKLVKLLGGTSSRMGNRVAKLRNQGLIDGQRIPLPNGSIINQPLMYKALDAPYEVNDMFLRRKRIKKKIHATYESMGENVLPNLDDYLYPNRIKK